MILQKTIESTSNWLTMLIKLIIEVDKEFINMQMSTRHHERARFSLMNVYPMNLQLLFAVMA